MTGFGTNGVSDPTPGPAARHQHLGRESRGRQPGCGQRHPSSQFITGPLQQAMGAQTNAIYHRNGGALAPMVSPNASSGSYTGGSATFQDGLIQYVGPNPGSPAGDATCQLLPSQYYCEYQQLGEMYIQLSYLTNPQYSSGLLNDGNPPVMTATVDSTGNCTHCAATCPR